jgi:hypothetical protein
VFVKSNRAFRGRYALGFLYAFGVSLATLFPAGVSLLPANWDCSEGAVFSPFPAIKLYEQYEGFGIYAF